MTTRSTTLLLSLLALTAVHCSNMASSTETAPPVVDHGIEPLDVVPTQHCWAQIERLTPSDPVLKIGTSVTVKTGGAICPDGVTEKLGYRYYFEKIDRSGRLLSPRVSPQGPTEWSLTKSTFDTTNLPGPGRYRIYAFSIPRQSIAAWQANDPVARALPQRSGNAYTDFVTTSWGTGTAGACSATCGGGVSITPAVCKDNNGTTRPEGWCTGSKPADDESVCNTGACPQAANSITFGGVEDFMLTNTSGANMDVIMMPGMPMCWPDPMMGMFCMPGPPMPMPVSDYAVQGSWQDAETPAAVSVKIVFLTKPTATGDYTATGTAPPGSSSNAYVYVTRTNTSGNFTAWVGSSTWAAIKVRTGADTKLHVLVDDVIGGTAIKADLGVEP